MSLWASKPTLPIKQVVKKKKKKRIKHVFFPQEPMIAVGKEWATLFLSYLWSELHMLSIDQAGTDIYDLRGK